MQKRFTKIFHGASSAWLILTLAATIPTLGLVISTLPNLDEFTPGPIAKVSDDLIFSCFNLLQTNAHFIIASEVLLDAVKLLAEIDDYTRQNDLCFNFPAITYRQPASDHSSEGAAIEGRALPG